MSVILDALRKLDREKSLRKNTPANFAVEILRLDPARPEKRIRRYVATVIIAVVATLAIMYGLMVKFGSVSKSSAPAPVISSSSNQQIAPVEPSPPLKTPPAASLNSPAPGREVAPAPLSREPARDVPEGVTRTAPRVQTPSEGKVSAETQVPQESETQGEGKVSATSLDATKTDQSAIPEKRDAVPEIKPGKIPEPKVSDSPTSPPHLRLSAIIWYEEPSMRFAMVNGFKANEGSVVEGAKVVEINPTSVRFLHNGQYFEISLSK
jgi:cytoskeletal protein RodZ